MVAVQPRKQIKVPRALYVQLERDARQIGLSTQAYAVSLLKTGLDRARGLETLSATQRGGRGNG
jgi:hypothetical protein